MVSAGVLRCGVIAVAWAVLIIGLLLVTKRYIVTVSNLHYPIPVHRDAEEGTFMSPGHTRVTRANACPAHDVLSRVGDKWSVLVIALLDEGSKRFSELRREIPGISQRMLTLTLRGLDRKSTRLNSSHLVTSY